MIHLEPLSHYLNEGIKTEIDIFKYQKHLYAFQKQRNKDISKTYNFLCQHLECTATQ